MNYLQDDWANFLLIGKFASNNQISDIITTLLFFAIFGSKPKLDFEFEI
jgi:hypothetical protein